MRRILRQSKEGQVATVKNNYFENWTNSNQDPSTICFKFSTVRLEKIRWHHWKVKLKMVLSKQGYIDHKDAKIYQAFVW